MKQRAVMAIATALRPRVIIADEPTSALDVVVQRQVMQTLGQLQGGLGAAVVLIGHDMGLIAQFADIVGVMYAGKLVEIGPVEEIIAAPRHPYTRLLIDSLPSIALKKRLVGIPGLPPPLVAMPAGCSFHPRCPYAFDRCRIETPALQNLGPSRKAACHLYPQAADAAAAARAAQGSSARDAAHRNARGDENLRRRLSPDQRRARQPHLLAVRRRRRRRPRWRAKAAAARPRWRA